jgi:hypothetical protein
MIYLFIYLFILAVLRLELRAFTLSHSSSLFCEGFFKIGSCGTGCLGWLQTMILLISASWITGLQV